MGQLSGWGAVALSLTSSLSAHTTRRGSLAVARQPLCSADNERAAVAQMGGAVSPTSSFVLTSVEAGHSEFSPVVSTVIRDVQAGVAQTGRAVSLELGPALLSSPTL